MSDDPQRNVELDRIDRGSYRVTNPRGGTITIGTGEDADFTPVELLLAAIGGCSAIDVDLITSKRAEPETFRVRASGEKIRDDAGNRMQNLGLHFAVRFPGDEHGDAARSVLPSAITMSHDRLCTVSRTVEVGTPVATTHDEARRGEAR